MTKNIFRTTAITFGGLALAAGAWTAVAAPVGSPTGTPTISAAVAADLAFSRDEERMARDLYAVIAAQYGDAIPFSMITDSEQRHFDAIGTLLVRYGVADPASGKSAGVYANADIQKLYDSLLAQSKSSLTEAYKVGIAVEKRDIADVTDAMKTATQADIDRVYANLLNGSDMHLRAFTDASNGIITTHTGTGMQQSNGTARTTNGAGNGMGMGNGYGSRTGNGIGMGTADGDCVYS